jgi:hypothetical protein
MANNSVINWNDEASKKVRSQTVCKKDRKMTTSGMFNKKNQILNK